jgi:hypothetical protein
MTAAATPVDPRAAERLCLPPMASRGLQRGLGGFGLVTARSNLASWDGPRRIRRHCVSLGALPDDPNIVAGPQRRRECPLKHDPSTWTVKDDWLHRVPVTDAEVDVFEALFVDLFDEQLEPDRLNSWEGVSRDRALARRTLSARLDPEAGRAAGLHPGPKAAG